MGRVVVVVGGGGGGTLFRFSSSHAGRYVRHKVHLISVRFTFGSLDAPEQTRRESFCLPGGRTV